MERYDNKRCGKILPKLYIRITVYLFLCVCLLHPSISSAEIKEATPLPSEKPSPKKEDGEKGFSIFSFSISEILSFGQPPLPTKKPVISSDQEMSDATAELYKQIFEAQAKGDIESANKLIASLRDYRLRGHILFQRYMHPTAYKSSYEELSSWLSVYQDHPGADRIYNLALRKQTDSANDEDLTRPKEIEDLNGYLDLVSERKAHYKSNKKRSSSEKADIKRLNTEIRSLLGKGAPSKALEKLKKSKVSKKLDTVEYDILRAAIANSYMLENKLKSSLTLAHASNERSGSKVPQAGWVAGLVSWRQSDYGKSAKYFEKAAVSPYSSPWAISASSYWASRAHLRAGNIAEVSKWLRAAAQHPRTFYGIIATKALGWDFDFNWEMPQLTQDHKTYIENNKAGRRAMALVQAEQYHLAALELKNLYPKKDLRAVEPLLAYANDKDLPALSIRLAAAFPHPNGGLYDAAFYPVIPWQKDSDYKINKALVHALVRQESKFNPHAQSHSGATGLMQIMPTTAYHISGNANYKGNWGKQALRSPLNNLKLGQDYVKSLVKYDSIGEELFSLLIAYNAGPGNLRKWKRQLNEMMNDPLLFVESIPVSETRAFVERVMANYWIYRIRFNQDTSSLQAVASGDWARYASQNLTNHALLNFENINRRKPDLTKISMK